MYARSPTAFFLSLLLHGMVVTAIVVMAFVVQQHTPPPVHVFELVAGPPTDLTATAAPALGSPEGTVDVKIPEPPAPRAEPVMEEPAPPSKSETARHTSRSETAAASATKAPSLKESRLSYDQYVKKYGKPAPSKAGGSSGTPRVAAVPQIKTKGIPDGVNGGSSDSKGGGGGTALTTAQHSALDGYIARLVAALRQNHEKPPGLSDMLFADVEFLIAADGTISRVQIVRSSGNTDFDLSCLEAFKRMGSVGPKPDGKSDTWVLRFRMKEE
jgi:colicin import membrane protein